MTGKAAPSRRRYTEVRNRIVGGIRADDIKRLAAALRVRPNLLQGWILDFPDFAEAMLDAEKERLRLKEESKGNPGRPTLYTEEMDEVARELVIAGHFQDHTLADALSAAFSIEPKIGGKTIYRWKQVHPSFAKAIEDGRKYYSIHAAENGLIRLAEGITVMETSVEPYTYRDKNGNVHVYEDRPIKRTTTRELPPNERACRTILTNKDPVNWPGEKQTIKHEGTINIADLLAARLGGKEAANG